MTETLKPSFLSLLDPGPLGKEKRQRERERERERDVQRFLQDVHGEHARVLSLLVVLFLFCRPFFARNSATFSSSRLVSSFLLLRVFHFPKESALRVKILLSRREDERLSLR